MHCTFKQSSGDTDIKTCTRCGLTIRTPSPPEKCHANCRKPGLGDYVAKGLSVLGFKPKPACGCEAKRDWLNRAGVKVGL